MKINPRAVAGWSQHAAEVQLYEFCDGRPFKV
jgi:hypothetical protein